MHYNVILQLPYTFLIIVSVSSSGGHVHKRKDLLLTYYVAHTYTDDRRNLCFFLFYFLNCSCVSHLTCHSLCSVVPAGVPGLLMNWDQIIHDVLKMFHK